MTNRTARIVVLISGAGSIMAALASACEDPEYRATIAAVIADRADAAGLEVAANAGIPTAIVSPGDFQNRATWDSAVARTAAAFTPDLVVCAGFMRLLGDPVLRAFPGHIVNTHPALLPAFPGAHAVKEALAAGVKVTGCTVMISTRGSTRDRYLPKGPSSCARMTLRPLFMSASRPRRENLLSTRLARWCGRDGLSRARLPAWERRKELRHDRWHE